MDGEHGHMVVVERKVVEEASNNVLLIGTARDLDSLELLDLPRQLVIDSC